MKLNTNSRKDSSSRMDHDIYAASFVKNEAAVCQKLVVDCQQVGG
jgi:hypothetical protein